MVVEIVTDGSGAQVLCHPIWADEADPDRLRQTHLEQVVVNQGFRSLTEFLTPIRYFHLERSARRRNGPFRADFPEAIATTP